MGSYTNEGIIPKTAERYNLEGLQDIAANKERILMEVISKLEEALAPVSDQYAPAPEKEEINPDLPHCLYRAYCTNVTLEKAARRIDQLISSLRICS
jgi:hypothetical protein